jgi:hypothetical protein
MRTGTMASVFLYTSSTGLIQSREVSQCSLSSYTAGYCNIASWRLFVPRVEISDVNIQNNGRIIRMGGTEDK